MENITLSVNNLKKVIGKKEIIKGITFELKEGEVFGFLGPNGAGKTTTIRMLVGLIKPTSGTIKICGYNIQTHFYDALKNLGCIVENPELYPYLSGWNNLLHFARMLDGVGEDRIKEVTELVGLTERIHDKVKTYSLGMRQRLGIAQALLGTPRVLILDEPTNGLDPAGIREMRQFIRFLAEKEGLSVLVSSHLLSEIQLLCDRVAIITKGTIIKTDTVQHLLSNRERVEWHLHPFDKGKQILAKLTKVELKEMNRKLPVLEDLFLELTGGVKID
jgi:ABC-2 type transport system ATP-binding protein